MLVVTRHINERIVMTLPDGRRVYVALVDICGGSKARIGFEAPPDVILHREEVQRKVDGRPPQGEGDAA